MDDKKKRKVIFTEEIDKKISGLAFVI